MNENNQHQKELEKICRLCKKKIKLDKHYRNAKRATEVSCGIEMLFDYDITSDVTGIHPNHVCKDCVRKIDLVKKKDYEKVPIAEFDAHDKECQLCKLKRYVHPYTFKLKKLEGLTLSMVEEVSEKVGWKVFKREKSIMYLVKEQLKPTMMVQTSFTLKISLNDENKLVWVLSVYNRKINTGPFFVSLPKELTKTNFEKFLQDVYDANVCSGNTNFPDLIKSKLRDIRGFNGATIEDNAFNIVGEGCRAVTIRSEICHILLAPPQQSPQRTAYCSNCMSIRSALRTQKSRLAAETIIPKMKRPHSSLSKGQLQEKIKLRNIENKELKRRNKLLEKRISESINNNGVVLDEKDDFIRDVVSSAEKSTDFKEGSVMRLLWDQQRKAMSAKSKTSMRWHPVMLRWSLSIYLRSPSTYERLRQSGFLLLPSKSTLHNYTSFTETGTSFNPDIVKRFCDEYKVKDMKDYERNCILAFDEMKIKEGLVYSKNSGKIIGFTELGTINQELKVLEDEIEGKRKQAKPLATHMLCVMVRGLFTRFNFPLGYYATRGVESYQLYPILWQGVGILEGVGMFVRAFCCDGAAPNRKFFLLHEDVNQENISSDGVIYWTTNRYDVSRKVYFFSDVPHLLKTLRNNLENSGANRCSRNLIQNGQQLSWIQLRTLYELDLNLNSMCPGLRNLPRLTNDHINLGSRTRMRVNLAAQVLSRSVADALAHQGYPTTKSLETFIRHCDNWFDCMNVQSTFQGQKTRKDFLKPYEEQDDPRFDWLENCFLKYFNDWEKETENLPGSKGMKAKSCISYATLNGIRITTRSFLELVPQLLEIDGVRYFLSDKLNQDPVEEHFSRQRMRGGGCDNPTMEQYMLNERKIIVAKSDMILSIRGNTRGRMRERTDIDVENEERLPKKPKMARK